MRHTARGAAPIHRAQHATDTFVPVAYEVVERGEVAIRRQPNARFIGRSAPVVLLPQPDRQPVPQRRRAIGHPVVVAAIVVLGMLLSFLV